MNADVNTIFESDFYRILDFKCLCSDCKTSKPEYSETFSISFVRKGNFLFNVFRNNLDSYTGTILITKPKYERTVTHVHTIPDECTIIDFKKQFYDELLENYPNKSFFFDNDVHATLIKTTPETEFIHYQIIKNSLKRSNSKLFIDNLIFDLIEILFNEISTYQAGFEISKRMKYNHLTTIENAKDYMIKNFDKDISLLEIAVHCNISPFHFSRIFKVFTSFSPYQFLLNLRLKNAELLLRNTEMKIQNVAFASGFNSIEHFTTSFRLKYNFSPSAYKSGK